MESNLRKVSNILTMLSVVYQSVCFVLCIVLLGIVHISSFDLYTNMFERNGVFHYREYSDIAPMFIVFLIIGMALLFLIWTARMNSARGDKAWSIYGIVYSTITLDFVGVAGYICSLVDANKKKDNLDEDFVSEKEKRKKEIENELTKLRG